MIQKSTMQHRIFLGLPKEKIRVFLGCTAVTLFSIFSAEKASAEGTKQVSPNSNTISALAILPDQQRGPFLTTSPSPGIDAQRLRVRIADLNEKVYFGFHWMNYGDNTTLNNVWMRIYDPSGIEVARYRFRSGADGWITGNTLADLYSAAVAGPNGPDGVTAGYTPYVFTPTVLGEYSVIIYQGTGTNQQGSNTMSAASNWQKSPVWDITVANTTSPNGQQVKLGRLFSHNWSFVANSTLGNAYATAPAAPVFYSYSHDQTLIKLAFGQDAMGNGGFMPIAYNVGFTHYGIDQSLSWGESRKSKNSTFNPAIINGYKVFLSEPSSTLYPIQQITTSPNMAAVPITGCPGGNLTAHYELPAEGDVRILFDIDGNGDGYTAGTRDFVLEAFDRPAGSGTIVWDGKDGLGNNLVSGTSIKITATYQRGRFNLPIYDAEVNKLGMYVQTIAPLSSPSNKLYWDDASLTNVGSSCNDDNNTQQNNVTGSGWNNSFSGSISSQSAPTRSWNGNGNLSNVVPAPAVSSNDANARQCDDYGNVRVLNTWGWALEDESEEITFTFGCYDISGFVMHDVNGLQNNLVDNSAATPSLPSGPTYVHLVNGDGMVVDVVAINSITGAYSFTNKPAGTYKTVVSSVQTLQGVAMPSSVVPSGWNFVGEQIGTVPNIGVDMITDGELGFVLNGNLGNINFGIQQPPTTASSNYNINQPAAGTDIPLDGTILNTSNGSVDNTIQNDVDGQIISVTITEMLEANLPVVGSVPSLYYDGVEVTLSNNVLGDASNPFDPDLLAIRLNGMGYTGVSFKFTATDNTGSVSNESTYSIQWNNPLPVTLKAFKAAVNGGDVALTWNTYSEYNNKGFEIERSNDAKQWQKVGFEFSKAPNGTSASKLDYTSVDKDVAPGVVYYRLRQVDFEGTSTISEVVLVTIKGGGIELFPNPATTMVTIKGLKGTSRVALYDMSGRKLIERKGVESGSYDMSLNDVAEGLYTIVISTSEGTVQSFKLHKK